MSDFSLGTKSEGHLSTTNRVMQRVVRRAIQITDVDFSVVKGIKTLAEQQQNVDDGVSWTMTSYHLPNEAGEVLAVDIYPWVCGASSEVTVFYMRIAKAMFQAAQEVEMEGYKLEWGGFWHAPQTDMPHWQLIDKRG